MLLSGSEVSHGPLHHVHQSDSSTPPTPTLVFTHRASSGSQDYWLSICTADQMASYSDFDRQVWLQ